MAFRFQNFPVYKEIKIYIKNVYHHSSKFPKDEQFGLSSQLQRAATSIALNLTEGSDRGSDKKFSHFIQMAIGSLNETVAIFDIGLDNEFINGQSYDIMIGQAENIVKQLSGLRRS
ncbi:four helix bundle protein [Candidatus Saganbacteria bacterium CG08_land_8_20_14_0_20_45_16]|uniref:Four helix bundle protein n=1 Tax=Candidatus Saganbacteria bacterium CG08_land_8_20_14_0_20_45_16 TaxID=2014293 RepID=A0A2H0XY44_UNCSA|nr:MAG: four helix bundle protein [Candidatus Saganbacteria bacterium CG08_land_8_20_14_0_20_45_16]